MPATFHLWDFEAQLWVPLTFSPDDLRPRSRSLRLLRVFARVKPDADDRQAKAEMQTIAQRIAQEHKDTNEGWGASVKSLQRYSTGGLELRDSHGARYFAPKSSSRWPVHAGA